MVALTFLPPFILFLARMTARQAPPDELAAILVFVLCPCAASIMSVFLMAAPAVASELEGRSWTYLSVRPYGPTAVLIGKYLVAISWAIPVGLASTIMSLIALMGTNAMKLIPAECGLVVLSCLSYAGLFLLLGVIVPKRAMVLGIVYTVIVEIALATVPAVINTFTIQYRLRSLLVDWAGIHPPDRQMSEAFKMYFGDATPRHHVMVVLLMTAFFLAASTLLLRYREFTSAMETDT
jgi:ABC-type transport system involved in multi-copper enzyme maturation permease subunit